MQWILRSTTYEGCLPLNLDLIKPLHVTASLQETWRIEKQVKQHHGKKSAQKMEHSSGKMIYSPQQINGMKNEAGDRGWQIKYFNT